MARYQTFKEMFQEHYALNITPQICKNILKFLRIYELRQTHPEALNSPYLGLKHIYFHPKDQHVIFDEFDIIKNDLVAKLKTCKNYDQKNKVISDPYNLFTIWIVHSLRVSKAVTKELSMETQIALITLLHYKFFTSLIIRRYPYGSNEAIMIQTVENLSGKFDIKKPDTPTWRLVMIKRSRDVLIDESIHVHTLNIFGDDQQIGYVISDIQTRLRNKINLVTDAYSAARAAGERVDQYKMVDEIDGDQVISAVEARYEQMIIGISRNVLSLDQFIDNKKITLTAALVRSVQGDIIKKFLTKFSDMAVQQYKSKHDRDIDASGKIPIYIGYRELIGQTISSTYGAILRIKGVNMKSKLEILTKVIHQYRASRITDEGIIAVKESVGALVDSMKLTKRDETRGGLRLAFIVYIILMSFDQTS